MQTLRINDHEICWRETGNGPTIVLIHGWSLSSIYWAPQIAFLSKRFRVVAYDWRGMGCSTGGEEAYHFQSLVEEAKIVIDTLCGDTKPILIGHSLGGNIILQLAIERPEQARALVVVDSPLPHRIKETLQTLLFSKVSERTSLKLITRFAIKSFWGWEFALTHPEVMKGWRTQFEANSVTSLINSLVAWSKRPNPIPNLDRIKQKALLVAGSKDRIAGKDMKTLHQAFPTADWYEIQNAAHMSFVEKPEEFNNVLDEFLKQLT